MSARKSPSRKTIRVALRGGLGNQLFQLAAAWAVSGPAGNAIVADARVVVASETPDRRLFADALVIQSPSGLPGISFARTESSLGALFRGVMRRGQRVVTERVRVPGIWDESGPQGRDLHLFFRTRRSIRGLRGYFQDERIVLEAERLGFPKILIARNPSGPLLKMSKAIDEVKPTLLHVRLGDFRQMRMELPPDYFAEQVQAFEQHRIAPEVWVMTDGSEAEIAPYLSALRKVSSAPVREIEDAGLVSPSEILDLASRSPAFIGSRGTFSWWCAHGVSARGGLTKLPPNAIDAWP